ncbi:hypothetical protein DSECCO2_599510 [anaerobic digester metagenome]
MGNPVLLNFAQPASGNHDIAGFCQRYEVPGLIRVDGCCVLATAEESTFHFIKIILQAVKIARQNTGA